MHLHHHQVQMLVKCHYLLFNSKLSKRFVLKSKLKYPLSSIGIQIPSDPDFASSLFGPPLEFVSKLINLLLIDKATLPFTDVCPLIIPDPSVIGSMKTW